MQNTGSQTVTKYGKELSGTKYLRVLQCTQMYGALIFQGQNKPKAR